MQKNTEDKLTVLRQTEKGLRERLDTVKAKAVRGSNAQVYTLWATPNLDQANEWLQLAHASELVESIEAELAEAGEFIARAELCDPVYVPPHQEDLHLAQRA